MLMMHTLNCALHTKKNPLSQLLFARLLHELFHQYEASKLRLTIVDQKQVRSAGYIKTQPQN